jgi:AcrR family transcriptional regulator
MASGANANSGVSSTRGKRGAATRARILDAAVASIDAVGFANTTAQQIARAAGVSVGAVQHHFPAKSEILDAVLEHSFDSLARRFEGIELEGLDLEARISLFVDRAWLHYGSATFRSTLVILSNVPDANTRDARSNAAIRASAARATKLWNRVFSGVDLPARSQREIRQYAFASLSGLAISNRLQPNAAAARAQTETLEIALAAVFEEARARHRRERAS